MKKLLISRSAPAILLPLAIAVGLSLSLSTCDQRGSSAERGEIRLVLQITVDGLRGDLLDRYRDSFGVEGFKRLLDNGAVFTDANYRHANTETIVGHTTLATGTDPAVHGMIGNAWLDLETGALGYNIEDPAHPLLPSREDQREGGQVDPAQAAAGSNGRSPRNILAPAFADVLSAYHGGHPKIFAVSGKDRGAVPMAGHTGKAFWMSTDSGDIVTSSYYYEDYPEWAAAWNAQRKAEDFADTAWELGSPPDSYLAIDRDERPYEVDLKGYGRSFPHPFGPATHPLFATRLLVSPVGDELVADFAKSIVEHEKLGGDGVPDLLALSFSGVDAVNHFFGPSSLENEEVVRRLDRTLADLFTFIDKTVGLEHTLIVLSADHGMADMPEYITELGYEAGRLTPKEVVDAANKAGSKLGVDEVVKLFFRPYLYLDHEKIAAAGVELEAIEHAVSGAIEAIEGVEIAAPTRHLDEYGSVPIAELVRNNQNPDRSGDLYVAQSPYWFFFDKGPVACMHGSPWRYDTHVPIIFSGPGIQAARISRPVQPADVAPTIAGFLGITPPGSSTGEVLPEVAR